MIKSAAFKLTLWYLGIILILSALFSVALYRESAAQLNENAAHQRVAILRLPLPDIFENRRTEFLQNMDNQLEQDHNRLLLRLLVLNLATLMLGGGAAYALARRTLRPIQKSMEAQGRFTADASHELRTPLTAMRTEIEVALREKQLSTGEARDLLAANPEERAKRESLSAGRWRWPRGVGWSRVRCGRRFHCHYRGWSSAGRWAGAKPRPEPAPQLRAGRHQQGRGPLRGRSTTSARSGHRHSTQ